MAKIQFKRYSVKKGKRSRFLRECRKEKIFLESGEEIQRGCGFFGLYQTDVGWRCLYCGNYLYQEKPDIKDLWFHFRVGREYWRISASQNKFFINGVPVSGLPDCLPQKFISDLAEPRPPKWFPFFVVYEGYQFKQYLERCWNV